MPTFLKAFLTSTLFSVFSRGQLSHKTNKCFHFQETPFKAKTQLIRDSDSPEYNETFIADILPKARNCQRVFKRHSIKFEIYSKG